MFSRPRTSWRRPYGEGRCLDRRFYRSKYGARRTLEAFSASLRDETNLDALNDELVSVVRKTIQPSHVSLWLRTATPVKAKQVDQPNI